MASSRQSLTFATAAGIALGAAYALSPVTLWCGVALIGLFVWAGHDLPAGERRWVLGLLAVAVALRVLLVALLFLNSHPSEVSSFFWDGDGAALARRSLSIRDVWLGNQMSPFYFHVAFDRLYGWTTYLYVIAYVQYVLGPAPYAIHLLNVTLCTATAIALHRLVRSAYGWEAALLGFALLLFLPTPLFWSVGALKESLYLFLATLALVAAVTALRSHQILRRAAALLVLAGAVAAIDGVRAGALLIVTTGLGAGFAASVVVRRVSLVLLLLIALPLVAVRLLGNPVIQARVMSQLRASAQLHLGNVRTEGHSYKVLDQRVYSETVADSMTPAEADRFVVRALASFIVVPLPWQTESASEMVFLPQQAVWYVLVVLAFVGVVAGLRRDALVTCMLAGLATTGAAVIALNSGNIGTMVRHRDTVVPFVVWLSALGGVVTVSSLISRSVRSNEHAIDR